MDLLTEVLSAFAITSTLYCRSTLTAPWGLQFAPSTQAIFHVVDSGHGWLTAPAEPQPVEINAGDLILLPHGAAHELRDAVTTPITSQIVVGEDAPIETAFVRLGGKGALTTVLCGTFRFARAFDHPLLTQMPSLIHMRGQAGQKTGWLDHILPLLGAEAEGGRPGSALLLRRLMDVVLIQAVRSWVESQAPAERHWVGALGDPQIGLALRLMHREPAHRWTVAALAQAVALSRSAFAARFHAAAGEPPLHYLTRWRMIQAAHLLQTSALAIGEIAEQVGYASETAFTNGFKKRFGQTPSAYRSGAATATVR